MKTRFSLLAVAMLAAVALSPTARAQAAPTTATAPTASTLSAALDKLGGTFVYDPSKKNPILAVTYEASKLTGVLGSKVDLSLSGIVGAGEGGALLGFGALYTRSIKLTLSNELKGVVDLTAGPAVLYGTGGGKAHVGFVAGLGFRF